MANWNQGTVDPIRIVPAADLLRQQGPGNKPQTNGTGRATTTGALRTDPGQVAGVPVNSAFYPPYNKYQPYEGFVQNYRAHAYTGVTGDRPFTNTLNPTLRRYQQYRTPPSKHNTNFQRYRLSTGRIEGIGTLDTRYARSFSGPLKRPAPLYQKRRNSRPNSYHLAETYGTLYDARQPVASYLYSTSKLPFNEFSSSPPLFYVQPYGTIPSKKLIKKEQRVQMEDAYPLAARLGIKLAEFFFGLIILGLLLSPTRGFNLGEFLRKSQTEWQAVLMVSVTCLAVVAFLLLATICCANRNLFWRRLDIVNSALSSFLYLVLTCIEVYYAACYPPNGAKIALVCYRLEWIVAAVMCFLQTVVYLTDMLMALRTGVSLL